MKKLNFLLLGLGLSFTLILQTGCFDDTCTGTQTWIQYNPVYLSDAQLHADISAEDAKDLRNPGKIYFYNNYILINEFREGIHIINNEDPSNPVNEKFISIPGNVDMAMRNGVLYANRYFDLLEISLNDINNPVVLKEIQDITSPDYSWEDQNGNKFAYYEVSNQVLEIDCSEVGDFDNVFFRNDVLFTLESDFNGGPANTTQGSSSNGIGGSMARFTLYDHYLYVIDDADMHVIDVEFAGNMVELNEINIGWNIETIFPFEDNLFIGSTSGMYIYSNEDPTNPTQLSVFEHANACDPVVVEGRTAYVTLRNGNTCQNFTNQLDVIDISDLKNPTLIKSYDMLHPHGLAVKNSKVFLCEGEHGLKVLNAENPKNVKELSFIKGLQSYDVIALSEDHLLLIGADGFYQYDSSDPKDLEELSHIPVIK